MKVPPSAREPRRLHSAGLSDCGRVRAQNEDAIALDDAAGMFVLSDGMGGRNAGAVAALAVTTVLPGLLRARLDAAEGADVGVVMRDALVEVSREMHARSRGEPGLSGMGATAVVAWFSDGHVHLAHMGDSRAYRLRGPASTLEVLTADHSLAAMLVETGELTVEDARAHSSRSVLSRFMGMPDAAHPDVSALEIAPGDRYLLCSDGLTGMVEDPTIARILSGAAPPEEVCRALVDEANACGGADNISVIVIEVS